MAHAMRPTPRGVVWAGPKGDESLEGLGQYVGHQLPINLNNLFSGQGNSKGSCWYKISYQFDCFVRGEPFAPVSLCRFILIHISCFEQRSGLPSFQLLAVLEI